MIALVGFALDPQHTSSTSDASDDSGSASNGKTGARSFAAIVKAILNLVLIVGGVLFFVYLLRATGVTWHTLNTLGFTPLSMITGFYATIVILDVLAYYYSLRFGYRVGLHHLFVVRLAGDAMTNSLPGGVFIGETYKAVMLKRWENVTLFDSVAALLALKIGLGLSQALFIAIGLALSYGVLREHSSTILGFSGAHYLGFLVIVGMVALLTVPLILFLKGPSFDDVARFLRALPLGTFRTSLDRLSAKMTTLEQSFGHLLYGNRQNLSITFAWLFCGWIATTFESYLLLHLLDLDVDYSTAFAIESVGSMFRLVFFMVPAGLGGQDASFVLLFSLYRLPKTKAGLFVVVKRIRELFWVGVGGVIVLVQKAMGLQLVHRIDRNDQVSR